MDHTGRFHPENLVKLESEGARTTKIIKLMKSNATIHEVLRFNMLRGVYL